MGSMAENRSQASFLAEVLKALAHPERLRIVAVLAEGRTNVIGLAGRLKVGQPIVSQQLRILRMSGLVAVERRGGFSVYSLAQPRLRALLRCLEGCHSGPAGAASAPRRRAREEV